MVSAVSQRLTGAGLSRRRKWPVWAVFNSGARENGSSALAALHTACREEGNSVGADTQGPPLTHLCTRTDMENKGEDTNSHRQG